MSLHCCHVIIVLQLLFCHYMYSGAYSYMYGDLTLVEAKLALGHLTFNPLPTIGNSLKKH